MDRRYCFHKLRLQLHARFHQCRETAPVECKPFLYPAVPTRLCVPIGLYNNSYSRTQLDDGTFEYRLVNYFNPGLNLSLQQPIEWTGGTVSINSGYNYMRDFINVEKPRQWNASPFYIQLFQPVFAFRSDCTITAIRVHSSTTEHLSIAWLIISILV